MARRFVISGRVQGVGFRAFAEREARQIGVTGWVRNLDDGRVEVQANGSETQLDQFEGMLRQGPRWSDVRGVETLEIAVFAAASFSVRRG